MKYPLYNNVEIMEHPLIIHKISKMRDEQTGSKEFREYVDCNAYGLRGNERFADARR